ncbi:MAG: hypothetical protein AB7U75_02175 [Hyphomicrobiaceae bacterium]
MSTAPLPIETLVRTRSAELALTATDLVRRTGYANVAKGIRRLNELYSGQFDSARGLIERLPTAIDLPEATIQQAIQDSRQQITETEEADWRAKFKPHAVILTERLIPQPIHIAAIVGVDQLKRIDIEPDSSPLTVVDQAFAGLKQKLKRWHGSIPTFGEPTGLIINYSPDHAVRFDLDGRPLEIFDRAFRLGHATLTIRGRECSSAELRTVFGIGSG